MKNFQKSTFQFIHFQLIPDQKNPCQNINILHEDLIKMGLTLFDMTIFSTVSHGERGNSPPPPYHHHHNFVVTAPMIMEFGTVIKPDAFYIMITKKFVMSLLLRTNYHIE